jgi:hypothetical protein
MDSYEDRDGQPSDAGHALQFLRRLPGSLLTLDGSDAAWLCGVLQQGEGLSELSMMEATEVAAKMVPPAGKAVAPLCSPELLCKRVWQAVAIALELDKDDNLALDFDMADQELPKWVDAVKKVRQGDATTVLHRWQVQKLTLGDRWSGLWQDAGQLLDYQCKKRLTEWLPQFSDLPKAPAFNVPNRQPPASDKLLKNVDDHLRELGRAVRCLHLSLLQDEALVKAVADTAQITGLPLQVPSASVQIENLFTLIGACSVYVDNCRLKAIDTRLEYEVKEEDGLVGKVELARLEAAQKLQSKMPSTGGGKGKSGKGAQQFHPYSQNQGTGSGKGKGKGRGGKGKGKGKGQSSGFVFPAPAPAPADQ